MNVLIDVIEQQCFLLLQLVQHRIVAYHPLVCDALPALQLS